MSGVPWVQWEIRGWMLEGMGMGEGGGGEGGEKFQEGGEEGRGSRRFPLWRRVSQPARIARATSLVSPSFTPPPPHPNPALLLTSQLSGMRVLRNKM